MNTFNQDFAPGATMGKSPIINKAMLINYKDPNTSFINKKFGYTVPKRTSVDSTYIKLCTITLTGNDSNAVTRFLLFNNRNADKGSEFIEVDVKAVVYGDISTGTKHCWVTIIDSHRIYLENIVVVETLKDETGYIVEVYFKSNYGNRQYTLIPVIETVNLATATIEYTENQASQADLPEGTQVVVTGGSFLTTTIRVGWNGSAWTMLEFPGSTNMATLTNADDNVLLYGLPTYTNGVLIWPETSLIRAAKTKLVVTPYYKNTTTLPYLPLLTPTAERSIRFIDVANSYALVTATEPSENMSFLLQVTYERR